MLGSILEPSNVVVKSTGFRLRLTWRQILVSHFLCALWKTPENRGAYKPILAFWKLTTTA